MICIYGFMDIQKIEREFLSVKGKQIQYGEEVVYIEDLYLKNGHPQVLLSNDNYITLMEAVNMVSLEPKPPKFDNFNEESEPMHSFFPGLQLAAD